MSANRDQISAWCAWQDVASAIGKEAGLPAQLLPALIDRESRLDPDAPGGIAQIDRRYHVVDHNPYAELRYAARFLAQTRADLGRWDLAIAAYNVGTPTVQAYGAVPPAARGYVMEVLTQAIEPSPCGQPTTDATDLVVTAALLMAAVVR